MVEQTIGVESRIGVGPRQNVVKKRLRNAEAFRCTIGNLHRIYCGRPHTEILTVPTLPG